MPFSMLTFVYNFLFLSKRGGKRERESFETSTQANGYTVTITPDLMQATYPVHMSSKPGISITSVRIPASKPI